MSANIHIRFYRDSDAASVLSLFLEVNRKLAPPDMNDAFQAYVEQSIDEEIGRIPQYYSERGGGFWVAEAYVGIIGMFGLEKADEDAMELRRMYVAPAWRKRGIARQMLAYAEDECRQRGMGALHLSTSELQQAALNLYQQAGYVQQSDATEQRPSNKTVGQGIRRYQFAKTL